VDSAKMTLWQNFHAPPDYHPYHATWAKATHTKRNQILFVSLGTTAMLDPTKDVENFQ
jgi:hypothetical protein